MLQQQSYSERWTFNRLETSSFLISLSNKLANADAGETPGGMVVVVEDDSESAVDSITVDTNRLEEQRIAPGLATETRYKCVVDCLGSKIVIPCSCRVLFCVGSTTTRKDYSNHLREFGIDES